LEAVDSSFRFSVFLGERRFSSQRLDLHYSKWPTAHPAARIFWEQIFQPLAIRQNDIDVLHAMAFTGPLLCESPLVTTIYDLSFFRFPEIFRPFNRWYLSRFTRLSARRAKRIIAISESTKKDVIHYLGVPEQRVDVIYCGVDQAFRPVLAENVQHIRRQYGLPDRFVLFLGTLEPRKNVELLIRAYGRWREEDADVPHLVICGAKGWYFDRIFAAVENLGLEDFVVFTGYVAQADLPALYSAAELFVYPSKFEGFGLPVAEAMACGTPVITSNVSSLPEVGGDAALLVSPDDEQGLAENMRRVWRDAEFRQHLSESGKLQAKKFSWSEAARLTVRTYEGAVAR
jgi:glycosyltransferase involved in cell wall biosynthesis